MPPKIPYDAYTTKKDFVMVVLCKWFGGELGLAVFLAFCRIYGSESNLDTMYLLACWPTIQSFRFAKREQRTEL